VSRRVRRWVAGVLVLVLIGTGLAAYRLDILVPWYDHFFGDSVPSEPSAAEPAPGPGGLDLPPVPASTPVAAPLMAPGSIRGGRVRAAIAPHLADPALGPRVLAAVADLETGALLARSGPARAVPASLTKLLTGLAALSALGSETTFETTVVADGPRRVVLVGGGDPYLGAEDVVALARDTAQALRAQGRRRVAVRYDDSLFTGPAFNPAWPPSYAVESVVSPITSLWVDQGRVPDSLRRVEDPALVAAQRFAAALARAGIRVDGAPERSAVNGRRVIARLESVPVRQIVQALIEFSDNEATEVLLRHIGLAVGGEGSFTAGVDGVLATLDALGIDTAGALIYDGSGLSRENRLAPEVILAVVRTAATGDPAWHALITGLPVAGFTGTLAGGFDEAFDQARGRVRAKTGTLTAVSGLAGVAQDQQGHLLLFVLMADRIAKPDEPEARDALERAAGALGACRCG
jgi:D-alanyl-D-alanine carboxypeptidase/D-alanyl-D-alanine-endopeptidase (penicillin-binding protein 4)